VESASVDEVFGCFSYAAVELPWQRLWVIGMTYDRVLTAWQDWGGLSPGDVVLQLKPLIIHRVLPQWSSVRRGVDIVILSVRFFPH
jgi:hypothetical protein